MSEGTTPPCRVCGKSEPVLCYPDDHSQTICPDCCPKSEHANGETGHEIIYARGEGHYCTHCGEQASEEWHRDRACDAAERDAENDIRWRDTK